MSVFGLDDDGLDIVGTIQSGLPDLGLPDVSGNDFLQLLAASVGVMLVGFAEGLGAAKTYAARAGYDVDPNRELVGLGVANLGAGLASGMVVNGSLSKTAVNGAAGAKSQISGLTAAALTVVTLLFLTGLFEKLPEATLAAVVVAAVIELVDIASLRRLWRVRTGRLASVYKLTSRVDFVAAAATLLGVLLFETLPGLVIGIGVSLALLIARTSRPHIAVLVPVPQPGDEHSTRGRIWVDSERNPDLPAVPGILVVRVEAPLHFTNADVVREHIRALVSDGSPRPAWWSWTATPLPPSTSPRPPCSSCSARTCTASAATWCWPTTSGRYATSLLSPNRTTSRPCTSRSRRRSQRRLSRETGPDPWCRSRRCGIRSPRRDSGCAFDRVVVVGTGP